jgi:Natural resistance-associated macrophage protein
LAGQVVMEGFMDWKIRPWLRRLITRLAAIMPAIFLIGIVTNAMCRDERRPTRVSPSIGEGASANVVDLINCHRRISSQLNSIAYAMVRD